MNTILNYLKNKQLVWHGNHVHSTLSVASSGFSELDLALGGGFPEQGVVDIHSPVGIGELRLLLPCLHARQQNSQKLLVFIAPPMQLNSEMLAEYGLPLSQILFIQPDTIQQALWSAEQCLRSGCCQAVLLWQQNLEMHQAKRLQLAAEQGQALQILLRSQADTSLSLPLTLSMTLDAHPSGLRVHITKRKGGWPRPPFVLSMRHHWPALSLAPIGDNILHFPAKQVS
jgi:cell division inhibitor SulA